MAILSGGLRSCFLGEREDDTCFVVGVGSVEMNSWLLVTMHYAPRLFQIG